MNYCTSTQEAIETGLPYRNSTGEFYRWIGESWVKLDDYSATRDTQKVKGISTLSSLCSALGQGSVLPYVIMHGNELTTAQMDHILSWRNYGSEVFVRPCPMTPRHGFVESRKVNIDETKTYFLAKLKEIYSETLKYDKDGQVLIMPYINAAYNSVLANGSVTIGIRHDGATANRKAIMVPTADIFVPDNLKASAGIENSPFIETVVEKRDRSVVRLVQLRDGPTLPRSRDFVPFPITVKRVFPVNANVDLLKFAEDVKSLKDGTVVYCKDGGINSHVGIHCSMNNIPFIVSKKPRVGETLRPTTTGSNKKECERSAFLKGVETALRCKLFPTTKRVGISARAAVEFVLFIFHSVPFFDLSEAMQARLLGIASGLAVRLGMIACIGEARYFDVDWEKKSCSLGDKASRERVYTDSAQLSFDTLQQLFLERSQVFGWPGGWSGGVGGPRWLFCAIVVARLWNSIVSFCDEQRKFEFDKAVTVTDCVAALNALINVSHNCAKLLTKFIDKSPFDVAASWRLPYLSMNIVDELYRFSVDRIPLNGWTVPTMEVIDLAPLMPTTESVKRALSAKGLTYRSSIALLSLCRKTYVGIDICYDDAALELPKIEVPWPVTDGCSNCQNSPVLGSFHYYSDNKLEPCAGCNVAIFGDKKAWKAVTYSVTKTKEDKTSPPTPTPPTPTPPPPTPTLCPCDQKACSCHCSCVEKGNDDE